MTAEPQPRARRAADVTTVLVGAVLLVWALAIHTAADPLQEALRQFAEALPEWAVGLLVLTYTLGLLYAAVVLVTLVAQRRWAAVRDAVVAGSVATGLALTLVAVYDELWPPFLPELLQGHASPQFPVVRVAAVTAVLVASSPSLARPIRRLGWLVVVLVGVAAITMALGVPSGVVAGLGIGLVCSGGWLLVVGSPSGYPDVAEVGTALHRVGVDVPDLRIAPDQSWGVRRLVGTTSGGTHVEVKAYGRDAMDSQVMAKVWRALAYRDGGRSITLSRVQSVEHEALVTLLAREAGVPAPDVLAAAGATEEVAVLVTTRQGTPLQELGDSVVGTEELVPLWRKVATLHEAGITHGNLSGDAVRWTGDGFVIGEFAAGSVVFRESDAALDVVHLLVATASVVGTEGAAAAAATGLGTDRLAACLGYLQPPALTSRERRSVPKASKLLKSLHERVVAVTGADVPPPVKLRRLGLRDVVTILVAVLFLSALVPLLLGIDYAEIWTALQTAQWWLVVLSVLVGQIAFIPQGTAMMCAVGRRIPLRPMTILQPAVAFISFAVPGMVGRVTMESAFLYKYGVPPAASVTKGTIDSFAGFLVQIVILVVALLTGAVAFTPPSGSSSGGVGLSWWIVVIVVGLAVATVVAVLKVPKLHDRVVPQVGAAWEALTDVLRSPRMALGLLGSQAIVQFLWGLSLWLALASLGTHLSIVSCTAVVVATAVLQGIIPVPGGVGVSEAVMSAFLVPLGVPSEAAMGAAVIWRVATFYLPATEGFFAAKYLQRHGYL